MKFACRKHLTHLEGTPSEKSSEHLAGEEIMSLKNYVLLC